MSLVIEYVSPDGLVKEYFEMADGMTLEQAARTLCPDTEGKFPVPTIAIVGSKPAVKSLGDWDCPLAATRVQFRQLALGGGGGGGSNPLQMVLQIAIIALAAFATWYIGGSGAFLGISGAFEGLGLGSLAGGLAGAGVMLLGTMLTGMLFQNKLPQGQTGAMNAEQASPTYNINSSGNQARLYQVEPELFGRMKIVPDFVANTWTEYINNDQIGYFVYALGRGYYDVESLQFGETVFWRNGKLVEDSGYEILDIEFVEPDNPVTIFPDNVVTSSEVNGQQLFAPNQEEYEGALGPYATNAPGTFTNRLLLDFVFQQGIGHYKKNGKMEGIHVYWKVEAQKIDDFGVPLGDWQLLEWIDYSGRTVTPQRITRIYDVENGRYQVRVTRTDNHNGDGRALDTVVWAGMKAMLPGTYRYPISCVAFSVRANNALTQSASRQFSVIATRKLPLYDRKTKKWSAAQPTRSWAAAVSHVCKAEWGGQLADADIDLDTLWAIDEKLQAKNWFYDSYIDGAYLVWTLLCEMCQSQCVIPRLVGPVLSFVEDAPNRSPVFALTPRNIVRGSFSINYATWTNETPDDVTVEYLDADYGFQQRDVTAKLPESESKEPTSLDILGITDRSHAHKVAVSYAAHNRWQRISVECQVEALGRIINRGDICTVAHPRFRNTCAGAIKSWDENRLLICAKPDYAWPENKETDGYYFEKTPQSEWPKTIEQLVEYGVKGASANIVNFTKETTLFIAEPNASARMTVQDEAKYIAFTKPDGSIWGPCKIAEIKRNNITLDAADYSTLLLQGQGNPFEWFSEGIDRQPTAWTLYDSRTYQRLMVVDSVTSQDALHYNLKLLNYDERIYQYGSLPVPIWQGRGQLPDSAGLAAPKYLKGTVETDTAVTLSWLYVEGASWYEVQMSLDGQHWTDLGKTSETQTLLLMDEDDVGSIFARVRAVNELHTSSWAQWRGNTVDIPPDIPQPRLASDAYDGSAIVTWPPIYDAESYIVTLRNPGGVGFYTTEITGTSFEVTPEIQTGGPYRDLIVDVAAKNEAGVSDAGRLELSAEIPPAPTEVYGAPSGSSFILFLVNPAYAKRTGYIVAYGQTRNFDARDYTSSQAIRNANGLPAILNYSEDSKFYRVAFTDAFFDAAPNLESLNFSASQAIYFNNGGPEY